MPLALLFVPVDVGSPKGSTRSAPSGPRVSRWTATVRFIHDYLCSSAGGSTVRSNLFGSHWSASGLTLMTVNTAMNER
jgi:hypothetical protein